MKPYLPGHFLIENQFDLEAISTVHSNELMYTRYDAIPPTLSQMEQLCRERDIATQENPNEPSNHKDDIFPKGFMSGEAEVPVYIPLYNQLTRYTPAIKTNRELVIPQHIIRKSLKNIDFSAFNDITTYCSYSFSSYKYNNGIEQLLDDDLSLYWQSDSNSSPHWINIQLPSSLLLAYLCIYIDCTGDESYTPNEFVIKTGLTAHSYTSSQLIQLAPPPTGWLIIPLQDMQGYIDKMNQYTTSHQLDMILNDALECQEVNRDDVNNNIRINGKGDKFIQYQKEQLKEGLFMDPIVLPYTDPTIIVDDVDGVDGVDDVDDIDGNHHSNNNNNNNNNNNDITFFHNDQSFHQHTSQQHNPTTLSTEQQQQQYPSTNNHNGYRRQFNAELPPVVNSTYQSFIPSFHHSKTTISTTTTPTDSQFQLNNSTSLDSTHHHHHHSTTNSLNNSNFMRQAQPQTQFHSLSSSSSSSSQQLQLQQQQPPFNLIAQQHKLPSFHMLIEILSSYQLGRDCRLRGLKLYSYKPQY